MFQLKKKVFTLLALLSLTLTPALAQDIHKMARKGSLQEIKTQLEKSPDQLNSKNGKGNTPLHLAAVDGRVEVVNYLISRGADVNAPNQNARTPIYYALMRNHTPVVQALLDNGANVNHKDKWDVSPLHWALFTKGEDALILLIKKGADIHSATQSGYTPLYYAVDSGSFKTTKILLAKGADANIIDPKTDGTLLHMAAQNGHAGVVKLLLAKGVDAKRPDKHGKSPFYYACRYGHKKAAILLKKSGAAVHDDSLKTRFGFSKLLKKNLPEKVAAVWYLGNSGWAVKTQNHLLIFDYFFPDTPPTTPLLANGNINPQELRDLKIMVFVSHAHRDHYNPEIFKWADNLKDITFILGFQPKIARDAMIINPREHKTVAGIDITTIESNDAGVGFLVKVDGLSLFHAGDHALNAKTSPESFNREIDFLAGEKVRPDMAFLPVTGCGFGDPEGVCKGIQYAMGKMSPKVLFPMHSVRNTAQYQAIADKIKAKAPAAVIGCAEFRGDHFIYKNGKIKQL